MPSARATHRNATPAAGPVGPAGYRLTRRLDRGGPDEVYEAVHPTLPGRVAIKLLGRALSANPQAIETFRNEAMLVSSLDHPNCVRVMQVGAMPDGVPFVAMEYLQGHTLHEHLAAMGPLSPAAAAAWIKPIAAALAAAHGANVVHGELRPNKVLLVDGQVPEAGGTRVLDFAVWRLAGGRDWPGRGLTVEAARFTAPELNSPNAVVDGRADQFSLAAVVFRMLSTTDAFAGEDVGSVLRNVLHDKPRALVDFVSCGPEVEAVLRRGLSRNPAQRFATVTEFADAFQRAAQSGGVPEVTHNVSESQIVSTAPASPAVVPGPVPSAELGDPISENFFTDGQRQEAVGHFNETSEVKIGSLDRVPRRWFTMLLLTVMLLVFLGGIAGAGAWLYGLRPPPEWQRSWIWQTLQLPTFESTTTTTTTPSTTTTTPQP